MSVRGFREQLLRLACAATGRWAALTMRTPPQALNVYFSDPALDVDASRST
jgi:hypothetical protein